MFFFFKQMTAYELRISVWSSDVCSSDLHPRQAIVLEPLTQRGLEQLAGRGMRQFVDEDDLVGQPPFGDARGEMVADLRARHLAAPSANDDQQRPFVPFGMRDADRRGLGDAGAPDRDVFKLDRTRSEEHTSELQSLMRISYAVFCVKK